MAMLEELFLNSYRRFYLPMFKRGRLQRYQYLCEQLAEHEAAPSFVDDDAAVRVLISLHTTLQPSEWDKLTPFERLPFLERTAEALGLSDSGGRPTGTKAQRTLDIENALLGGEHPNDVATRFKRTTNYINKIRRKLEADGKLSRG